MSGLDFVLFLENSLAQCVTAAAAARLGSGSYPLLEPASLSPALSCRDQQLLWNVHHNGFLSLSRSNLRSSSSQLIAVLRTTFDLFFKQLVISNDEPFPFRVSCFLCRICESCCDI